MHSGFCCLCAGGLLTTQWSADQCTYAVLQEDRTMYQALECCAEDAIGPRGSWAALMDSGLVNNLGERPGWAWVMQPVSV